MKKKKTQRGKRYIGCDQHLTVWVPSWLSLRTRGFESLSFWPARQTPYRSPPPSDFKYHHGINSESILLQDEFGNTPSTEAERSPRMQEEGGSTPIRSPSLRESSPSAERGWPPRQASRRVSVHLCPGGREQTEAIPSPSPSPSPSQAAPGVSPACAPRVPGPRRGLRLCSRPGASTRTRPPGVPALGPEAPGSGPRPGRIGTARHGTGRASGRRPRTPAPRTRAPAPGPADLVGLPARLLRLAHGGVRPRVRGAREFARHPSARAARGDRPRHRVERKRPASFRRRQSRATGFRVRHKNATALAASLPALGAAYGSRGGSHRAAGPPSPARGWPASSPAGLFALRVFSSPCISLGGLHGEAGPRP